jgi:uncharacterized SAM-binding protein YcdF (DUF218 family)
MKSSDQRIPHQELPLKAQRARSLIYIVMAFFIILPFVLFWLVGSIRF